MGQTARTEDVRKYQISKLVSYALPTFHRIADTRGDIADRAAPSWRGSPHGGVRRDWHCAHATDAVDLPSLSIRGLAG